jgi:hypothetical protein
MKDFVSAGPIGIASSSFTAGDLDAIDGAMVLGIARFEAERLLERAKAVDGKPNSTEALLREMLRLRSVRDSR